MSTLSNRDIQKLYDRYNPNNCATGDRVLVRLGSVSYSARIVGLDLDLKNKKVYANLRIFENAHGKNLPIRVDVADCKRQ